MVLDPTQLVLGRGEVYFEPFAPGTRVGTGERYVGNTPSFQVSRSVERVERATSYKGKKVAKESPAVSESNTVQFITDNISIENMGIFYGQQGEAITAGAKDGVTETFTSKRGSFYQLGKSFYPNGVREIVTFKLMLNGAEVPAEGNFEIDMSLGRIQLLPDGTVIPNNVLITAEFSWRSTYQEFVSSTAQDVYGALRFISRAVKGPRRNLFFPFVRVTPRGAVDMKGDQWQQIPFDAVAMNLKPGIEQVYMDTVLSVGATLDEQAIRDQGGITEDEFPAFESQFNDVINDVINVFIPNSDYGQPVP